MEGSQENEDVRAAADFANIALTQHFNTSHYFALDSITNVRTQVCHLSTFEIVMKIMQISHRLWPEPIIS